MKYLISFMILLSFCPGSNGQTGNTNKECRTNVVLEVVLDTVYQKIDSLPQKQDNPSSFVVDRMSFCNPCYKLRPLNSGYRIVAFKLMAEAEAGEIWEINISGDNLTSNSGAMVALASAKKGEPIYFYCIKAKHENGNIYVLKDFSIIKR